MQHKTQHSKPLDSTEVFFDFKRQFFFFQKYFLFEKLAAFLQDFRLTYVHLSIPEANVRQRFWQPCQNDDPTHVTHVKCHRASRAKATQWRQEGTQKYTNSMWTLAPPGVLTAPRTTKHQKGSFGVGRGNQWQIWPAKMRQKLSPDRFLTHFIGSELDDWGNISVFPVVRQKEPH